jgi:hypothetical protein
MIITLPCLTCFETARYDSEHSPVGPVGPKTSLLAYKTPPWRTRGNPLPVTDGPGRRTAWKGARLDADVRQMMSFLPVSIQE